MLPATGFSGKRYSIHRNTKRNGRRANRTLPAVCRTVFPVFQEQLEYLFYPATCLEPVYPAKIVSVAFTKVDEKSKRQAAGIPVVRDRDATAKI